MIKFTLSATTMVANGWDGPHDLTGCHPEDREYHEVLHNARGRKVARGYQYIIECDEHVARKILRMLELAPCMDSIGIDPEEVRLYRTAVKRDIERLRATLDKPAAANPTAHDPLLADPARQILREHNDCAVRALAHATGIAYNTAHTLLAEQGRRLRRRTPDVVLARALRAAGCSLDNVTNEYKSRTVRTIARELEPHLTFLVRTPGHVLCVRGGQVLDWAAGRCKRIENVYRVHLTPRSVAMTTTETQTAAATTEAPTKKVVKKVATKKASAKAKKAAKGGKKAATKKDTNGGDPERARAKALGLSLVQLRVLNVLKKASGPMTYRDIEAKTAQGGNPGYYSILTAVLRKDHQDSLGAKGLVKEEIHELEGKEKLTFVVTAKGKALLEKK